MARISILRMAARVVVLAGLGAGPVWSVAPEIATTGPAGMMTEAYREALIGYGTAPATETIAEPLADTTGPVAIVEPDVVRREESLRDEQQRREDLLTREAPTIYERKRVVEAPGEALEVEAQVYREIEVQRHPVPLYFCDRLLDLSDFFRVRVHRPKGLRSVGLKARATALVQAGAIYFHGGSYGFDRRALGIWRERRIEGGIGPLYATQVRSEALAGNYYLDDDQPWFELYDRRLVRNGLYWDDGRLRPLSIGAEAHVFFFGIEAEAYPLEMLDFLFGWVGIDAFDDDLATVIRKWGWLKTTPGLRVRDEWIETLPKDEPPLPPEVRPAGEPVLPEDLAPTEEQEPYVRERPERVPLDMPEEEAPVVRPGVPEAAPAPILPEATEVPPPLPPVPQEP